MKTIMKELSWVTYLRVAAAAKSLQSCPTLCDPIDGSPLGSPVPGILQARTLEWVAISFSNAWKWKVKGKSLSRVRLPATPWTAAYQASPSMEFSRQEWGAIAFSFKVMGLLITKVPSSWHIVWPIGSFSILSIYCIPASLLGNGEMLKASKTL